MHRRNFIKSSSVVIAGSLLSGLTNSYGATITNTYGCTFTTTNNAQGQITAVDWNCPSTANPGGGGLCGPYVCCDGETGRSQSIPPGLTPLAAGSISNFTCVAPTTPTTPTTPTPAGT